MQASPTITLSVKDWLEILGMAIGLAAVHWRQVVRVNGLGSRVDANENLAKEERTNIRERVAHLEATTTAIREELSEERLAVMTMLHNNERAAAERAANLQAEVARLTERIDVQRIVRTVVSEFKRGGD